MQTCCSAYEVYFEVILYFLEDRRENSGQKKVNKAQLYMFCSFNAEIRHGKAGLENSKDFY